MFSVIVVIIVYHGSINTPKANPTVASDRKISLNFIQNARQPNRNSSIGALGA